MKIWHLNVGNHAGRVDGVAKMSTALANAQTARGHRVRLWVAAGVEHHEHVVDAAHPALGLEVHDSARRALAGALAALDDPAQRPDVVHLHSVFRPVHALVGLAARRHGIPLVQTPHAGLNPILLQRDRARKSAYRWLVERHQLRHVDAVVALQRLEIDDIRHFAARSGLIDVIANAADDVALRRPGWVGPARGEPPVVVMLTRYDVLQKGLDRMVSIAQRLPEVEFRVHGTQDKNDPERTRSLMAAAPPNVRFLPPVFDDAKYEALERASLFLLPSRAEGVSLALTEAMAVGVPCAVSSFVDRSLGLGERGAALVLPEHPGLSAERLGELLCDPGSLAALGAGARAFARERFDPDRNCDAHLTLYSRLCSTAVARGEQLALRG